MIRFRGNSSKTYIETTFSSNKVTNKGTEKLQMILKNILLMIKKHMLIN